MSCRFFSHLYLTKSDNNICGEVSGHRAVCFIYWFVILIYSGAVLFELFTLHLQLNANNWKVMFLESIQNPVSTFCASCYLSTNIPACTAWTILLNLGFSSARRFATPIFLLNVQASQSRTSLGTLSPCKSLSSSSASNRCLDDRQKDQ